MTAEKVNFDKVKLDQQLSNQAAALKKNEQSTIAFPNYDLDAAVTVARQIYARSGLSACPLDELAAEAKTTMSGNFRNKNSAARLFGFVEKEGQSKLKLTDLGARVISTESGSDARAAAFLNVPLYNEIYEKYRGKLLPPAKALEREMTMLGVIPTQSAAARQIFQRSARQGGYFNSGEDRLVRPRTTNVNQGSVGETLTIEQPVADAPPPDPNRNGRFARGGGSGGGRHMLIEGLLERLPEPDTVWAVEGRAAWLEACASVFKLIYQGDGKITVVTDNEKKH